MKVKLVELKAVYLMCPNCKRRYSFFVGGPGATIPIVPERCGSCNAEFEPVDLMAMQSEPEKADLSPAGIKNE